MAMTPAFDHILNDPTYVKVLAKKHLLDSNGRGSLSRDAVVLSNALASMAVAFTALGLGGMLAEDAVWKGQVAACNHMFAKTRKAITVIAYVNTIQALTGAEQAQTAETLLAKDVDVASPLLAATGDIVKNAQPTKSARKRRSEHSSNLRWRKQTRGIINQGGVRCGGVVGCRS